MNILLAYDGSEPSQRALQLVLRLSHGMAATEDVHVTVTFVAESSVPAVYMPDYIDPGVWSRMEEGIRQAGRDVLAEAERMFTGADVEVETTLLSGQPAEAITKYAAAHGVDLTIMGSRGLNAVGEMLLGSVSRGVLHRSHCPVTIVR